MLIDSHCHLNYLNVKEGRDVKTVLDFAMQQGVSHCICIGVELERFPEVLAIGRQFDTVKVSAGVHPCAVASMPVADAMTQLTGILTDPNVIALGECGLDYYREEGIDKQLQKTYFARQIELSLRYQKPLVVHTRCARDDTIDLLRTVGNNEATGVLHCFTESKEMATKALDLGLYISFSGIITFKNATDLQEVVKHVPLDRMLVETDSPYLAPVPHRGKENQPGYVTEVAKQVALLKQVDFETVCQETFNNTVDLFGWPC